MKTICILSSLIATISCLAFIQDSNSILTKPSALTTYKVTYLLKGKHQGFGTLILSPTESLYNWYAPTTNSNSEPTNEVIAEAMKKVNENKPTALNPRTGYWRDLVHNQFVYVEEETANRYSVRDDSKVNWTLLTDTRQIGNYPCQKAKATFRGRDYEVWFTKALPGSTGPWKLAGLPGLILEAVSTDQKYQFLFVSCLTVPANAITTRPAFREPIILYSDYLPKVDSYYQAQANRTYEEVSEGFMQKFGLVKTSPVTMNVENIEKDLEKKYVSAVAKK